MMLEKLLSRKSLTVIGVVAVLGITLLNVVPVSYARSEESVMKYGIEYKDEAALEMGTEQTAQEGKEGKEVNNYTYKQSLFNYLFRRDEVSKQLTNSKVVLEPSKRIVSKGLRKWQYMMCSSGKYRYYTDEHFKERTTGFTSKSPDYCEQNNEGKKVGLADSPKGTSQAVKPSSIPSGCTTVDIPFNTIYKDVSWLDVGQTQEGYGIKGFKLNCSNAKYNMVSNPIDKTIYRGTRQGSTAITPTIPTQPTQDYAAKQKCESDYSRARAQIIAGNAGNSSAMEYLQTLHLQCLRRAGF
jgi:hypothetical protein